jgi:hypothetical protein
VFEGTNAESIVDVQGRTNSLVRNTCFKIPGASSDSIGGMKIGSGVGFGKQCKSGGLTNSEKVGSGANASSFSGPGYTGSGLGVASRSGPSKKEVRKKYQKQANKTLSSFIAAGAVFAMFLLMGFLAIIKFFKR